MLCPLEMDFEKCCIDLLRSPPLPETETDVQQLSGYATYRAPCKIEVEVGGELLQPCVLCFGLLQDTDVRVGVFPEGEEVLISGASFSRFSLKGISAS